MKTAFETLTFLVLSCSCVHATGINILSEEHHLWGSAGVYYILQDFLQYDVIGSQPVSASVSGEYYFPWDTSPNPCASSASAGNFAIEVLAMYDSTANAISTYTFTADYNRLSFAGSVFMQYVLSSSAFVSLYDMTGQVSLFSQTLTSYWEENGWQEYFTWEEEFAVSQGHVFLLTLAASASEGPMAWGGTTEWKRLQCALSSAPQPIPEPGTALSFLLGLAVFLRFGSLSSKQ